MVDPSFLRTYTNCDVPSIMRAGDVTIVGISNDDRPEIINDPNFPETEAYLSMIIWHKVLGKETIIVHNSDEWTATEQGLLCYNPSLILGATDKRLINGAVERFMRAITKSTL